jgi:hypothetical protein
MLPAVYRRWLGVVLGLALCACERGSADQDEVGRDDFCAGYCDGLVRCGLADSSCFPACADAYHPTRTRSSGLRAVGACLSSETCDVLGSDDPAGPCFDRAAAQEPLRPALVSYCESASLNYFRCDGFWAVEECTSTMGLWKDEVLSKAQACHSKSCDALNPCEKEAFGTQ